ncbi:LysR substrate binding domain protein [compost metagenome]
MIGAIERMGRRWRISFTSSSLSGLQAAVANGMGISLLPLRAVTAEHLQLTSAHGLPSIDAMEVAIIHRPTADAMVKELAAELARTLASE